MADNNLDYKVIKEVLSQEENSNKKPKKKKAKAITKMPTILALLAWALLATIWVMVDQASPGRDMIFFTSFFGTGATNARWDRTLINISYILLIVAIGSCVLSLLLNFYNKYKYKEKLRFSSFFVSSVAVIVFVTFLMNFSSIIGRW
ncbi:MAG: hypothetical protein LBC71_01880 [Oscillospiraceae bacterium]|jgi:hypothetical protein|nr:hypothetical protein [Oscillospiraceae bacterium]